MARRLVPLSLMEEKFVSVGLLRQETKTTGRNERAPEPFRLRPFCLSQVAGLCQSNDTFLPASGGLAAG
jgi:hypothetical protein